MQFETVDGVMGDPSVGAERGDPAHEDGGGADVLIRNVKHRAGNWTQLQASEDVWIIFFKKKVTRDLSPCSRVFSVMSVAGPSPTAVEAVTLNVYSVKGFKSDTR